MIILVFINTCLILFIRGSTDITKNCIELNSQPVGLERINKTIYVATMDETLHCYTSKVIHQNINLIFMYIHSYRDAVFC